MDIQRAGRNIAIKSKAGIHSRRVAIKRRTEENTNPQSKRSRQRSNHNSNYILDQAEDEDDNESLEEEDSNTSNSGSIIDLTVPTAVSERELVYYMQSVHKVEEITEPPKNVPVNIQNSVERFGIEPSELNYQLDDFVVDDDDEDIKVDTNDYDRCMEVAKYEFENNPSADNEPGIRRTRGQTRLVLDLKKQMKDKKKGKPILEGRKRILKRSKSSSE